MNHPVLPQIGLSEQAFGRYGPLFRVNTFAKLLIVDRTRVNGFIYGIYIYIISAHIKQIIQTVNQCSNGPILLDILHL